MHRSGGEIQELAFQEHLNRWLGVRGGGMMERGKGQEEWGGGISDIKSHYEYV